MSYFQKHYLRANQCQPQYQNFKPVQSLKVGKALQLSKTNNAQQQFIKLSRGREVQEINNFNQLIKPRNLLASKQQTNKQCIRRVKQNPILGLMLEGDSSMEELLNSSINQFKKYLSDKDPLQQEHQLLKEQNQSLKASLQRLKTIIKQKLESALNKQRQELNAMLQEYVQLINKLLTDKEDMTNTLQNLEYHLLEIQQRCKELQEANQQVNNKNQELGEQKKQHIAKTKQQIDDFLQIIQQYEIEADQEGKQIQWLKQKTIQLQEQLKITRRCLSGPIQSFHIPPKTQVLLQLLQKAQKQNSMLRQQLKWSSQQEKWQIKFQSLQKQHEQQFLEYENAIRETLNKKDQCIARLTSIIESFRPLKG